MSETKLKLLKDYINDMLAKGFIKPSISPASTSVLFAKNPNGSLRLCIDYRGVLSYLFQGIGSRVDWIE
jgi:hypothetical protein